MKVLAAFIVNRIEQSVDGNYRSRHIAGDRKRHFLINTATEDTQNQFPSYGLSSLIL